MGCTNSKGSTDEKDTEPTGSPGPTSAGSSSDTPAAPNTASTASGGASPPVRRRSVVHKAAEVNGKERKHSQAENLPYDKKKIGVCTQHGIAPARTAGGSKPKINQDRGIVCWPFNGTHDQALFCVFDGHGMGGERMSEWCTQQITQRLEADRDTLKTDPNKCISNAVIAMDKALLSHPQLGDQAAGAGTTSNVLYFRNNTLRTACSGDSRAVLGKRKDGKIVAYDLSHDHKPDLPLERKRIEKAGGTVSAAGPRGLPPSRVWVNGRVGLAMSRSIGDGEAKGHGVIPDPEIQVDTLTPPPPGDSQADGDLFTIVASDGIWEFISSQQACDVVFKHESATAACEELVQLAQRRWQEEEGSYRDDITCIVAYLPFLEDRADESYDEGIEKTTDGAAFIDVTINQTTDTTPAAPERPSADDNGEKAESFAKRRLSLPDGPINLEA